MKVLLTLHLQLIRMQKKKFKNEQFNFIYKILFYFDNLKYKTKHKTLSLFTLRNISKTMYFRFVKLGTSCRSHLGNRISKRPTTNNPRFQCKYCPRRTSSRGSDPGVHFRKWKGTSRIPFCHKTCTFQGILPFLENRSLERY